MVFWARQGRYTSFIVYKVPLVKRAVMVLYRAANYALKA